MKLIIGLGNPGKEYVRNRHNAGFLFLDYLPAMPGVKAVKTEGVYMNDSGKFVAEKVEKYLSNSSNLSDLFIVHDDLDLRLGEFKINFGKGPQVHNGLISIDQTIGTDQYWHVRIGTDSRERGEGKLGDSGHDFVLEDFSLEELKVLENLFPKIYEELGKNLG